MERKPMRRQKKTGAQTRLTGSLSEAGGAGRRSAKRAGAGSTPAKAKRTRAASRAPAKSRKSEAARERPRGPGGRVAIGGVWLSSPDRVPYPEDGITKLEVAEYYEAAAEWLLPHIRNRPLTLVRCPDTYRSCFFQKHIDENKVYDAVKPIEVMEEKGPGLYAAVDSLEGVMSFVQLGTLEFHTMGCRADRLEQPDRFTLDLDPGPGVPFSRIVRSAHTIRELLRELELESFVKTTGGKGLHVVVPIGRRREWDEVKEFTRGVASLLVSAAPDEYTISVSKARRKGKILIDYLRNARGSIAVEAYSTRSRAGGTVATPVSWEELTPDLDPQAFNVRTMAKRFASLDRDPWDGYARVRQSITAAIYRRVMEAAV